MIDVVPQSHFDLDDALRIGNAVAGFHCRPLRYRRKRRTQVRALGSRMPVEWSRTM